MNEVITALGGETQVEVEAPVSPPIEPPADDQTNPPRTRKQILDDLAAGSLSPEVAMRLLRNLQ